MINNKKSIMFALLSFITLFTLISCQRNNDIKVNDTPDIIFNEAVAVIQPTEGNDVNGVVFFKKVKNGIEITARIEGLEPGNHGFHIHQFGDIRKSDGTSAGGHFNPENVNHGAPTDSVRHVGDLGNILANKNGIATYNRIDSVITFSGKHSIMGRGIIIHAGVDDLASQPTGAAGSRVAMGVIGIANPDYVPDNQSQKVKEEM